MTGNLFIISCTIRLVPGIFHQQLSQARSKKFPSGIEDAEGIYQCLAKFLKDEKANILRYRKANLDASKKGSTKVSVLQMHPDDNSQEPVRDVTIFRHPLNIEGKKGATKLGPDLSKDDIPKMLSFIYTRRNTRGMMMQLFDPLGFLTTVTCGFKIAVKAGVLTELGWDEPLPEVQQNKWKSLIKMTLESDNVEFPRSIRTPCVIGRPELVLFVDASESAFARVIYVRWRLKSGGHHTAFYTSKAKVTPKGLTIPRGELCACLLGVKLVDKVIPVMDVSPRRITILSDSTCTIASLDVNSSVLQPYFGKSLRD